MDPSLPALSPPEHAALARLDQCYDSEETVARPIAVEQLTRVGFDANEARDHLEQLRGKGYLYAVDAGLRLTPGHEHWMRESHDRS
jgi:hypothetical protein